MTNVISLIDKKYGSWTVIGSYIRTENNERKWLCRCECGKERYVLERSLLSGGSKSCGCVRKTTAYDLNGQAFGDLTVLHKAVAQRKNGGVRWSCLCSCGKECDVSATLLVTGRKTHCGCKTEPQYYFKDITGQKFNRLIALHPVKERTSKGKMIWHCRCECGKEVDVSYNELVYTNLQSCGCKKEEHNKKLSQYLTHIDGTSLEMLESQKIWANNTSGARGVYLIRGKYVAKIVFQKKAYYLGAYKNFEDAVKVRNQADDMLRREIVEYYDRWREKAALDPEWANENPINIKAKKCGDKIEIAILPVLK